MGTRDAENATPSARLAETLKQIGKLVTINSVDVRGYPELAKNGLRVELIAATTGKSAEEVYGVRVQAHGGSQDRVREVILEIQDLRRLDAPLTRLLETVGRNARRTNNVECRFRVTPDLAIVGSRAGGASTFQVIIEAERPDRDPVRIDVSEAGLDELLQLTVGAMDKVRVEALEESQ